LVGRRVQFFISGGQSGADRAGLGFAIAKGLEHGGFVPRGRKTEDGRITDHYNLVELTTKSHPAHTGRNVEESDGTVIFSIEQSSAFDALFFSAPSANSREKAAFSA